MPSSLLNCVLAGIRACLKLAKRKRIDAAFADMANDAEYQKEAEVIAADFEQSDWEALQAAETTGQS